MTNPPIAGVGGGDPAEADVVSSHMLPMRILPGLPTERLLEAPQIVVSERVIGAQLNRAEVTLAGSGRFAGEKIGIAQIIMHPCLGRTLQCCGLPEHDLATVIVIAEHRAETKQRENKKQQQLSAFCGEKTQYPFKP